MKVIIYRRSIKAVVRPLLLTEVPPDEPTEPFVPCVEKEVRVGPMRARTVKTFPIIAGLMFVPESWVEADPSGTWMDQYSARPMWRWDIDPNDPFPKNPICVCDWEELRPVWENAQPAASAETQGPPKFHTGDRVRFQGGVLEGYEGVVTRTLNRRVQLRIPGFLRLVESEASALQRL